MIDQKREIPELSVIILGYREEDRLPGFLAKVDSEVQRLNIPYEIVLVANYWPGSGDRTPAVASELTKKYAHLQVVAKPKAGMMGWDMRSGLEQAKGRLLAVIDGDGQFHPHDIVRAYQELREKRLDLCQAYRVERQDGWKRGIVSWIYNGLFSLLFPGTGLQDINAKPKIMTRETYQSLRLSADDWFIDAEIIIQARRSGCRMGQIPVVFGKREGGKSYVNRATILEFLKNLSLSRFRETRDTFKKRLQGSSPRR